MLAVLFSGCGSNVRVTGTVQFDDGSPLETGIVVFQSQAHVAKGKLKPGGRFVMGSVREHDGLPPGDYKVYIVGADQLPPGYVPPKGSDETGLVSLLAPAYCDPYSTPIEFRVSRRSDFQVTVKPSGNFKQ